MKKEKIVLKRDIPKGTEIIDCGGFYCYKLGKSEIMKYV